MKIIKDGYKKFVRVCEVDIYEGTCNSCGAVFELQYGEMGRETGGGYHTIVCPYCHNFHSDYSFIKLRRETMLASDVKSYDCLHSPTRLITESEYYNVLKKQKKEE